MDPVNESVTRVQAYVLKTALLGLRPHQVITISYLVPKAPTKALLSVDGCQSIAVERGYL